MGFVTAITATSALKCDQRPDDNEAMTVPASDRDDAPMANTSPEENTAWLAPDVWSLIGQTPGIKTERMSGSS